MRKELHLPTLPKDWQWRAHITDDTIRVEANEIVWGDRGPVVGWSFKGVDLQFNSNSGYDEIIDAVQDEVNSLSRAVADHLSKKLERLDAMREIAGKFIASHGNNLDV